RGPTPRHPEEFRKMSVLSLRPNEPSRPFRFGSPQIAGNGSPSPAPTHAAVVAERARQSAEAKAPAPPEKVVVRDLRFYYRNFEALKGINLGLRDKRVTAFIVPSGCGKSTLLRILNRISQLYPGQRDTGEVVVDGRS